MVEVDNWLWLFNVVRYFILMWLHKKDKIDFKRRSLGVYNISIIFPLFISLCCKNMITLTRNKFCAKV